MERLRKQTSKRAHKRANRRASGNASWAAPNDRSIARRFFSEVFDARRFARHFKPFARLVARLFACARTQPTPHDGAARRIDDRAGESCDCKRQ